MKKTMKSKSKFNFNSKESKKHRKRFKKSLCIETFELRIQNKKDYL